MIRLPNPWVILGVLAALAGAYVYGHHKGWWERDAEMQIEIAKKNEESRAKEQAAAEKLNQTATQLQEANDAVSKKQSDLDRAIRAGRVRLPAASCVQTPTSATPAPGSSPEAPSESERETLLLIAQIAADGDRAINQLNACIDAYSQVREQLNGHH